MDNDLKKNMPQTPAISSESDPSHRIGAPGSPLKRLSVGLLVFVVTLVVLGYARSRPLIDFIEYWTSSHLLVAGHNPYSLAEMFKAQQDMGWRDLIPLMFLSPPWTLSFLIPLGFIHSYIMGWLGWLTFLMAMVALSSWMLMEVYFGDIRIPEISDTATYRCLFAFTFFPVLLCLRFTQTTPLMLLGLAGFLYFEGKRKLVLAGAFLSLTLIKPQLLYLLWIAVLLKSFRQRQWTVLASSFLSLCFLTAGPMLFDRQVLGHYRELATGPYMQAFPAGVAALVRKMAGGNGTYWIQYVPSVFGVIWFARYWRRHGFNWNWVEHMPMLVTVSVLTSAYGWHFDQTLLVAAVIALAGWRARANGNIARPLIVLFTGLNVLLMLLWPFPSIALLPAPILLIVMLSDPSDRIENWIPGVLLPKGRG